MKKGKIILSVLIAAALLSGCSVVDKIFGVSNDEEAATPADAEEETPVDTGPVLKSVSSSALEDEMFYTKSGNEFYSVYKNDTNITEDELIATKADPTRILSFTKDNALIPTLYKDDSLIFYTTTEVPTFTWERFADCGYTIGLYNMQITDANKVRYVKGTSHANPDAEIYEGLASAPTGDSAIIIDKLGGKTITGDNLNDAGAVMGFSEGQQANADIYIGTELYQFNTTADTHILSSMEIFETTEYDLSPDGYAYIKIPSYFKSGYYMINGVGIFRYVANNKSEGMAGIDFSDPYYITDERGNLYTPEEWQEKMENENN